VKRLLLFLIGSLLLAGTLASPIYVAADGGPGPQCPGREICKP